MGIRVLSSGVDTLHASMRGTIRPELWELGQEAQQQARDGDPEPVELGDTAQTFNVQGHGIRGYGLWMSSPDWELMLTQSERFPRRWRSCTAPTCTRWAWPRPFGWSRRR